MTEAMCMVLKFSSWEFRMFFMTLNNKNEKNDWGNVHGLILFLGI